ncbi:hypothetical protein ACS0TY_018327 [Phlomoides rotata]
MVLGEFIQSLVDHVDNDMLTAMPSVEEIKRAVFDMEPSSSPGPYGFGANRVEDFRPIVMGNYLFKIFTKIIALRLGGIAAKIMTPFQFGVTQIPRAPQYLFYADDILIYDKATSSNIRRLQFVLSVYGGLSGQIYNPAKSKVYFGSVVTRRVRNFIHRTTGITHGSLHMSYIGVPVFRGDPRTCHLVPLADSIISKFSKWKGYSLSLAGRKCMINFLIAASLVHSMMVYYWPCTLLKKTETAMRNFL